MNGILSGKNACFRRELKRSVEAFFPVGTGMMGLHWKLSQVTQAPAPGDCVTFWLQVTVWLAIMSSGFVSEAELQKQRETRQKEWEKVRTEDQPIGEKWLVLIYNRTGYMSCYWIKQVSTCLLTFVEQVKLVLFVSHCWYLVFTPKDMHLLENFQSCWYWWCWCWFIIWQFNFFLDFFFAFILSHIWSDYHHVFFIKCCCNV